MTPEEDLAAVLPARLESGANLLAEIRGKLKAPQTVNDALSIMADEMRAAAELIRRLSVTSTPESK